MTVEFRTVKLADLVVAPENVRTTKTDTTGLQASILHYGLLTELITYAAKGPKGRANGKFAVAGGSRRHDAMTALLAADKIAEDFPVRIGIYPHAQALELSLTENHQREAMAPMDQYESFANLLDQGLSIVEISARFGVSELGVRQRLKLGRLSPKIRDVFRAGEMKLDQAMALTLSDDHAAQERAWFEAPNSWDRQPGNLKARLTENQVSGTDARAKLVGLDVYEAAGGKLVRDLFDEKFVRLSDVSLLDRLVSERLAAEAATLAAEGLAFVDVVASMHYDHETYRTVQPLPVELTEEEAARCDAIQAELEGLYQAEEETEETNAQIEALEAEQAKIEEKPPVYDPAEQANVGAVLYLAQGWEEVPFRVVRGLVRRAEHPEPVTVAQAGSGDEQAPASVEPADRPVSGALIQELTAHRTAGLRIELANNPKVALVAVAHAHALQSVYKLPGYDTRTCLELRYEPTYLGSAAPKIEETPAFQAMVELRNSWVAQLPKAPADLWDFLMAAPMETLLGLLAFGVSSSINAKQDVDGTKNARHQHADQLATALDLDMTKWWSLTGPSYFDRVNKAKILAAVSEGVSPEAAENIAGLKKAGAVAAALDRLDGKGWLPPALRTPKAGAVEAPIAETDEADHVEPLAHAAE